MGLGGDRVGGPLPLLDSTDSKFEDMSWEFGSSRKSGVIIKTVTLFTLISTQAAVERDLRNFVSFGSLAFFLKM